MELFLRRYGLFLLVLGILIYISYKQQVTNNALLKENKEDKKRIKELLKTIEEDLELIEQLKEQDTVYINEIQYVEKKRDKKLESVDTMSISTMQGFFTERYGN